MVDSCTSVGNWSSRYNADTNEISSPCSVHPQLYWDQFCPWKDFLMQRLSVTIVLKWSFTKTSSLTRIHTMCKVTHRFPCMSMLVATHMHRALGSRSNQELWLSELCVELLSKYNYVYVCTVGFLECQLGHRMVTRSLLN